MGLGGADIRSKTGTTALPLEDSFDVLSSVVLSNDGKYPDQISLGAAMGGGHASHDASN